MKVAREIVETEAQRIERMALDPKYPTDFEWGRLFFLLGGMDYEARTVENVRAIVGWFRAKRTDGKQ